MYDKVSVCVLHRAADLEEEFHLLLNSQVLLGDVVNDAASLDVDHHKVGLPLRSSPGIEQAGKVGVVEAGEDTPFSFEAEAEGGGVRAASHEFDGDLTVEGTIGSDAEVDGAHAAFAEGTDEFPVADLLAEAGEEGGGGFDGLEESFFPPRITVQEFGDEGAEFGGEFGQEALAEDKGEFAGLMEEIFYL